MTIVAKCLRTAIITSLAACGSHSGLTDVDGGEEMGHDFGFVGSGGYGRLDSGSLFDDGGIGVRDGGRGEGRDAGGVDSDSGLGSPQDAGGGDGATDLDGRSASDDGSGVGVVVNTPSGFFVFLDWVISGPHGSYSGRVFFGDAHSIEFVVGGIQEGSGYTITLTGTNRDGQGCSGTSAPFEVVAGVVTGAAVLIACPSPVHPADVTTGTVGVDASVAITDM